MFNAMDMPSVIKDIVKVDEKTVKFVLKQPDASLPAKLALNFGSIMSKEYADKLAAEGRREDLDRKPVGTGPFKLADFKMNEGIKLVKNQDYWKPGRPYLDAIEFSIIADRSTRMLSFVAGKFDMTFPADVTVPLLKNIKRDAPQAQCTMRESGVSTNLIVNRE
eukprot:gene33193-34030_t